MNIRNLAWEMEMRAALAARLAKRRKRAQGASRARRLRFENQRNIYHVGCRWLRDIDDQMWEDGLR